MAPQEKTVIAKLTRAEHTRLKRFCLAQNPPAKIQHFVRDLVIKAMSGSAGIAAKKETCR